ncbi:snRNA-activating protein complex subunit 3-like isoform X2 [Symsagittifera roscoffensis]|uniref:snRNA-activating protein complex subunit 3-like isoform X2 n=1 Tax=Symsagittifera roscoffensis TaxID=84072 RepID=UPI00307BBD32
MPINEYSQYSEVNRGHEMSAGLIEFNDDSQDDDENMGDELAGVGQSADSNFDLDPNYDYAAEYEYEEEDEVEGGVNKVKMGFFSDCKWVGPIVDIAAWRSQNYQLLGDEYMDRSLPKIDACMVSRALQISAAIADELISVCDSKQLQCQTQPENLPDKITKEEKVQLLEQMMSEKGIELNTLKMRKHRIARGAYLTRDDAAYPVKFFSTSHMNKEKEKERAKKQKNNPHAKIPNGIEGPEAVLTIVVLRVDSPYPEMFRCKVSHEIEVLSSQRLSSLRDFFPCSLDHTHFGEFSSRINTYNRAPTYKSKFPSGCFFIEGTFFDDLREPEAIRLSDTIVKWSEERDRGWKGLNQCPTSMHLVSFEHLTLQLGKPYLYLHQGTCEHVWMVTSVRLYHPHDMQSYSDYPRVTGVGYFHRRKCLACAQYAASWMLVNDELLPRSPCFLCERCLRELHYDHKGKKIDDFKALHFVDPNKTNLA